MFSDGNGGLWAVVTTAFCILIGGGAHAVLMAAALGRRTNGPIHWPSTIILFCLTPGVTVWFVVAAVMKGIKDFNKSSGNSGSGDANQGEDDAGNKTKRHFWRWIAKSSSVCISGASGVFAALIGGFLCVIAGISNTGREIPYQPIVGASLAVIAFASFGGYFLASRRARVGLASSFVLTFFMLFTFLLTLEYLNQTASGPSVTVLSDFMRDFRGHVALIVGFYFGTDAAVNIFKIWQSGKATDPEATVRADRDIASPRLIKST